METEILKNTDESFYGFIIALGSMAPCKISRKNVTQSKMEKLHLQEIREEIGQ